MGLQFCVSATVPCAGTAEQKKALGSGHTREVFLNVCDPAERSGCPGIGWLCAK